MNEPAEGDRDPQPRFCVCGKVLPTVTGQTEEEPIICPHCGTLITESVEDPSVAETQMINVREMARMAQKGLGKKVVNDLQAPSLDEAATEEDPDSET